MVQKNGELMSKAENLIDEAVRKGYLQGFQEGRKDAKRREDDAYQRGLDDAWGVVFNFLNMSEKNKLKTFGTPFIGTFITCQSATEAIEKIRKYEQEHALGACTYAKIAQAEPEQNPERFNVQRTIWFDSNPTIKTWKEETEQDNTLDEAIARAEEMAKVNHYTVYYGATTDSTTGSTTNCNDSSTDNISRQAVLDIAKSSKSNWIDNSVLFKKVNALSSVNPQPKTGYWIDTGSGQKCSECGEIQYGYDNFRYFCAKCGAKMFEPQEGSGKE